MTNGTLACMFLEKRYKYRSAYLSQAKLSPAKAGLQGTTRGISSDGWHRRDQHHQRPGDLHPRDRHHRLLHG